jgi:hypothetical protein
MIDIISKLVLESGYSKLDPTSADKTDVYLNKANRDYIIVAEYDLQSLASFETSDKTREIMQKFEDARRDKDVYKNTSLIISVKLNSFSEYDLVKNTVLSVEENPYAFRKYVALYTKEGIKELSSATNAKSSVEAILLDEKRFGSFEDGKGDDEFKTALELFVKLPFLSVRNMPEIEMEQFKDPTQVAENILLRQIFDETRDVFDPEAYLSPEEEIEKLLENPLISKFVSESKDEI